MTWFAAVVLALAAWRTARLVGWDSISEPLRLRWLGMGDSDYWRWFEIQRQMRGEGDDPYDYEQRETWLAEEQQRRDQEDLPELDEPATWPARRDWRAWLLDLIHCPYCSTVWTGAAWLAAWHVWASGTMPAATAVAVIGAAGLIGHTLDS